jgi:hypothetical protein
MRRALFILFVAGCGPSSYADFRDQYIRRTCDNARHCGLIGHQDPCPLPDTLPGAGPLDVPAGVDDGRLQYHSDWAQQCLDSLEDAPCDPAKVGLLIRVHCHNVVGPNVGSGGKCDSTDECVGGTCDGDFTCPGHCNPYPSPHAACQPGECDPTVQYCGGGDVPTCQPKKSEESSCATDEECDWPLYCSAGKCRHHPRIDDGKPCTASDICQDGSYCGPDGSCTALHGRGTHCDLPGSCGRDVACEQVDGGVCLPWSDEGRPCAPGICPATQLCIGDRDAGDVDAGLPGSCQGDPLLPAGPGEDCSVRSCQAGLFCGSDQHCQLQRLIGGPCDVDQPHCASGLRCEPETKRCRPLPQHACAMATDGGFDAASSD